MSLLNVANTIKTNIFINKSEKKLLYPKVTKMEPAIKSETRTFSCCVVCLRDELKINKECDVNDDVIKIYKSLVLEEVSLSPNPNFVF